jgi:hypothetical protein
MIIQNVFLSFNRFATDGEIIKTVLRQFDEALDTHPGIKGA